MFPWKESDHCFKAGEGVYFNPGSSTSVRIETLKIVSEAAGIDCSELLIELCKSKIENLKNLDCCGDDLFWFSCCPLKIEDSDGAPIRAIAWFE